MTEALLVASLATGLKFNGLENTTELVDTVCDLFPDYDLIVNNVNGTTDCFRANLSVNLTVEKDVKHFIDQYNTVETTTKRLKLLPPGKR